MVNLSAIRNAFRGRGGGHVEIERLPDLAPPPRQTQSVDSAHAAASGASLFDEPIARMFSGWGGLIGCAAGLIIGLQINIWVAIALAIVGALAGSALGVGLLVAAAFFMQWVGVWGLAMLAALLLAASIGLLAR